MSGKFVEGKENKEAVYWAKQLIRSPGEWGNPLILTSEVPGTGKTHLARWIAASLEERYGMKTEWLDCSDLTDEICRMITLQESEPKMQFFSRHKDAHLFVIENMDQISGKLSTEKTLRKLFQYLIKEGKLLILTGKAAGAQLRYVGHIQKNCYPKGAHVRMQCPGYRLRRDILRQKAAEEGILMEEKLIRRIAACTKNGWQLTGVLCQIKAHMKMEQRELNRSLVDQVLKEKGLA